MFTGIVQAKGTVIQFEPQTHAWRLGVTCSKAVLKKLTIGASIAIDGVCLTVMAYKPNQVFFDVINETLACTCLGNLKHGQQVNLERAARFGDEIGGHFVSGHIHTTATITAINQADQQFVVTCQVTPNWLKYIVTKGFIALSGVSLTISKVSRLDNTFSVALIPETRLATTLNDIQPGMKLNVEVDQQTKTTVDTITAIFADKADTLHTVSMNDQKA